MTKVDENIFVGDMDDYQKVRDDPDFVLIQACKHPCHTKAVGGQVFMDDPEYFVAKRENGIALNMIDGKYGYNFNRVMFDQSLDYIYQNRSEKKILIHCNQGVSRSPGIALLYLAREGKINNTSYQKAKEDFSKIYPSYCPGSGIEQFLTLNWANYIPHESRN